MAASLRANDGWQLSSAAGDCVESGGLQSQPHLEQLLEQQPGWLPLSPPMTSPKHAAKLSALGGEPVVPSDTAVDFELADWLNVAICPDDSSGVGALGTDYFGATPRQSSSINGSLPGELLGSLEDLVEPSDAGMTLDIFCNFELTPTDTALAASSLTSLEADDVLRLFGICPTSGATSSLSPPVEVTSSEPSVSVPSDPTAAKPAFASSLSSSSPLPKPANLPSLLMHSVDSDLWALDERGALLAGLDVGCGFEDGELLVSSPHDASGGDELDMAIDEALLLLDADASAEFGSGKGLPSTDTTSENGPSPWTDDFGRANDRQDLFMNLPLDIGIDIPNAPLLSDSLGSAENIATGLVLPTFDRWKPSEVSSEICPGDSASSPKSQHSPSTESLDDAESESPFLSPDDILKLPPNAVTGLYHCPHLGCTTSQVRRYNLKIHYMTHLGEETQAFHCPECARGFRRRFDMRRHRWSRHGVPLEETGDADGDLCNASLRPIAAGKLNTETARKKRPLDQSVDDADYRATERGRPQASAKMTTRSSAAAAASVAGPTTRVGTPPVSVSTKRIRTI
ncbi:hypothetical protein HK405_010988 [Cladochytrium tenue]|nr:hypothetical protein HK405_010988 [Cladochytrium tenue]